MDKKRLVLILAIIGYVIYFISPIDLIPDFTGLFGKLDDFALLAYLIWVFRKMKKGAPSSAQDVKKVDWIEYSDPYQILGVSREATLDEVEQIYDKLMHQYHPVNVDKRDDEYGETEKLKFDKIQWAYEELKRKLS